MIKRIDLDLTGCAGDHEAEAEAIINDLKERRLHKPGLFFHAFRGMRIDNVLKYGVHPVDREDINGGTEDDLGGHSSFCCAISHMYSGRMITPGLAVYDGSELIVSSAAKSRFKYPDNKLHALVAAYVLKIPMVC